MWLGDYINFAQKIYECVFPKEEDNPYLEMITFCEEEQIDILLDSLSPIIFQNFFTFLIFSKLFQLYDKRILESLLLGNKLRIICPGLHHYIVLKATFPKYIDIIEEAFIQPNNFLFYCGNPDSFRFAKRHFEELKNEKRIRELVTLSLENFHKLNPHCKFISELFFFMNSNIDLAYKKVKKIEIAIEIIYYVNEPYRIKQSGNTCGAAAFLGFFLSDQPNRCIRAFLNLLTYGESRYSLLLQSSAEARSESSSFDDIYLQAMKHASNRYVGYSKTFFGYRLNSLELFRGITSPFAICHWLEQTGNTDIKEAMVFCDGQGRELSYFYHKITNIHAKQHISYATPQESIDNLMSTMMYSNQRIIFLLSAGLCGDLYNKHMMTGKEGLYSSSGYDRSPNSKITLLGVQIDHYVAVETFSYDKETQKVTFFMSTLGVKFHVELDEDEFFKNYQGYISYNAYIPDAENLFMENALSTNQVSSDLQKSIEEEDIIPINELRRC